MPEFTTRPRIKIFICGWKADGTETLIEKELPGEPDAPLLNSFVRDAACEFMREYKGVHRLVRERT